MYIFEFNLLELVFFFIIFLILAFLAVYRISFIFYIIIMEVVFLSIFMLFILFAREFGDFSGIIFALMLLAIFAAETALNLTLFIYEFPTKSISSFDNKNSFIFISKIINKKK